MLTVPEVLLPGRVRGRTRMPRSGPFADLVGDTTPAAGYRSQNIACKIQAKRAVSRAVSVEREQRGVGRQREGVARQSLCDAHSAVQRVTLGGAQTGAWKISLRLLPQRLQQRLAD